MRAAHGTRAGSLAAALAFVFGSVAFYADHMAAPRIAQAAGNSHGSPELAVIVPAASPAGHAGAGAPARPEAKTTIAWAKPWGNKS